MQVEEKLYDDIIKLSQKKIMALELLCNFFKNKKLVEVLIQTKIIHNLFASSKILDINKLDLFHLQFTNSFLDLFKKLKKSNEQKYLLINDEINVNEDFIRKLTTDVEDINFDNQIRLQSQKMSKKMETLYRVFLTDNLADFNWADVLLFSYKYQQEYYRELSIEIYNKLVINTQSVYKNGFATIEKKLLGKLNILNFRVKFLCGFVQKNSVVEVYEFRDSNEKMLFFTDEKLLYFLSRENKSLIDLSKNSSSKETFVNQLQIKNAILTEQLHKTKKSIPQNVIIVLDEYIIKISSVNFVNELQNLDEQTNILKSMLNININ